MLLGIVGASRSAIPCLAAFPQKKSSFHLQRQSSHAWSRRSYNGAVVRSSASDAPTTREWFEMVKEKDEMVKEKDDMVKEKDEMIASLNLDLRRSEKAKLEMELKLSEMATKLRDRTLDFFIARGIVDGRSALEYVLTKEMGVKDRLAKALFIRAVSAFVKDNGADIITCCNAHDKVLAAHNNVPHTAASFAEEVSAIKKRLNSDSHLRTTPADILKTTKFLVLVAGSLTVPQVQILECLLQNFGYPVRILLPGQSVLDIGDDDGDSAAGGGDSDVAGVVKAR